MPFFDRQRGVPPDGGPPLLFSAYLRVPFFSAVALFAGHDDQHHSQSGSAHQDDDPHGGVALVAGLDAGLGGLIAGIGCAAVGALAILVVMAGGVDDSQAKRYLDRIITLLVYVLFFPTIE